MIKILILLFSFLPLYAVSPYINGADVLIDGKTYTVNDTYVNERCEFSGPTTSYVAGNTAYMQHTHGCSGYYKSWDEFTVILKSNDACEANTLGICFLNLCTENYEIESLPYLKTSATNSEDCTTYTDGSSTGNIWKDSVTCESSTGSCYQLNTCFPPANYTNLTSVTTSQDCTVSGINSVIPITTSSIVSQAMWQECDNKCYVQTVTVDCSSQTPYVPTLEVDETIYNTDITLEQCVQYANSQNFDARYDTYSTEEAPGFSCQNLSFCIVKDRPHTCQGIDTPLPTISNNQSYFLVDSVTDCTNHATQNNVYTTVIHFDDLDNAGRSCYDVDYCIVTPISSDGNTTTGGSNGGTNTVGGSNNGTTTTTPDNTGTHSGTGSTVLDLNGTNDRLDIIDGHIKDGNQVNRLGFDRNHDDLNRLSQDIKDGSSLINRGLNGLSHGIGSVLDHIKNGEINSTGSTFDDTGIISANNNTTKVLEDILSFMSDDNSSSDFNITKDGNTSKWSQTLSKFDDLLSEMNISQEELTEKMKAEIEEQTNDFEDKSKDMIGELLNKIFDDLFNPFQPFIDVGSVSSNFVPLKFSINISSINYHKDVFMTKEMLLGDINNPDIARFYEIMQKLSLFLAVIFGFLYLVRGVSNV